MRKVWNCWTHSNCIVLFGSCLFWSRLNMFLWDRDLASADISILTTRSTLHIRGTFYNHITMGWPTMAYKGISKLFQPARSAAALFWPHLRAGAFLRRLHLHLHHTHIVLYCNILHLVLLIFAFASAQTILPLERNIYNKHLSPDKYQCSSLESRV